MLITQCDGGQISVREHLPKEQVITRTRPLIEKNGTRAAARLISQRTCFARKQAKSNKCRIWWAYADARGATDLLNWTEVGPKSYQATHCGDLLQLRRSHLDGRSKLSFQPAPDG
jgi:hypothetical protein